MKNQSKLIGKYIGLLVYSGKTNTVSVVWRSVVRKAANSDYVSFDSPIYTVGGGLLKKLLKSKEDAEKALQKAAINYGSLAKYDGASCEPPG